jgi:type II secretory pathway component PulF
VEKKEAGATEAYTLHVQVSRDGITADKDVTLTLRGKRKNTGKSSKEEKPDPASELEQELDDLIRETEAEEGQQIMLPDSLEDGTRVRWSTSEHSSQLVFLVFPIFIIMIMYLSFLQKNQEEQKARRDSVRRSIPVFTDQIMILLSCGLIFPDAFRRIAEGYRRDPGKRGFFERMIVECQETTQRTNRSLVRILNEKADLYRIRDFTRIVGYISDNQYRGVDLTGKLEASGRELWEERKKQAEEKGKLAETKMTMPLALLLLVLILVTAAPAIIQVEGGV